MNCGHDSNIEREKVIEESRSYDDVFFNTSIPKFDFPGPVVFTANAQEESSAHYIMSANMMFVRLRVSATNLDFIEDAVRYYTGGRKPVVLTFMAYYDGDPPGCVKRDDGCWFKNPVNNRIGKLIYTWKKRHINSYWCPTPVFIRSVLRDMNKIGGRLVTMCGTPDSPWCRDCRNCETYYWQTKRYMKEQANA